MRQYIIRRLLATIPLLFVISFFCFIFINLIPSDPAEVALRVRQTPVITPEAIAQVRAELGLDRPFFVRYVDWVWNCLQGDFGVSYTNPSRTVLRRTRPLSAGHPVTCGPFLGLCDRAEPPHRLSFCRL